MSCSGGTKEEVISSTWERQKMFHRDWEVQVGGYKITRGVNYIRENIVNTTVMDQLGTQNIGTTLWAST